MSPAACAPVFEGRRVAVKRKRTRAAGGAGGTPGSCLYTEGLGVTSDTAFRSPCARLVLDLGSRVLYIVI